MESFAMEIAGAIFEIHPLFMSTREYCRPYLTEKKAEFVVEVCPEDLIFQQALLEQEAVEEGLKIRKFQEPFLERATIQRRVAEALLSRDTLMLHGSTVAVDGKAYLFTAPCGTGKSTHTRLWREVFGDRAVMVNDDMPFVQIRPDGVFAYGSPWCGKHGLGNNICVPLAGICFLKRGAENRIQPAAPASCLAFLNHQAYGDPAVLVEKLAQRVPLWEMACNKEMDAALMAYERMNEGA